ncbi:MAG: Glycosyl transferase family 2 [Microgenomates group bacterium Gr01-1014_7]|nr:MAG: Glycosyl transferase family 2 [Microgenomates group bacterium Gr01-1014_7]
MALDDNPDLSIVILNYNVRDLLLKCLESVFKTKSNWQVIVVDNASSDGSAEAVREKYPEIELIENKKNLGFSAGNNVGVKKAKAPVVLFLNPDTEIVNNAIEKTLEFLLGNPEIGAVTSKVELPNGKLDYSCHRGFPTPWNAFAYFTGLSKLFPYFSLFAGYTATYLDMKTAHEIDCLTGAFLMVRKIAGEQIGWWDEDYFFNGEDIEFCFSLKEKSWKIYFYPDVKIIHYKGSSAKKERSKTVSLGISAMRIFYMKHYYKKYPPVFRDLVLAGIKMLEHYRKAKAWIYQ